MSKLRAIAEKELANLKTEHESMEKILEQTKQSLKGREEYVKDLKKSILELEEFLAPKTEVKQKKSKEKK